LVRYVVALAAVVLSAIAGIAPAAARRVALVIGNAEYRIGRLANPVNDAAAVAEALEKRLKFDKVLLRLARHRAGPAGGSDQAHSRRTNAKSSVLGRRPDETADWREAGCRKPPKLDESG
jgi:hypothetical protein